MFHRTTAQITAKLSRTSISRWISTVEHKSVSPVERLEERGLLYSVSSPNLSSFLRNNKSTIYTGFDPTATSLHVGSLLMIVGLLHFQAMGHQTIALVGGATGSIGDPSGKSTERKALDTETLNKNVRGIDAQIRKIFSNGQKYIVSREANGVPEHLIRPVKVMNNMDWLQGLTLLDFLGDVGRMARVSIMLSRDSVKNRLESSEGISFTEFSYQLLQAYDFYHLHSTEQCRMQLGGSDQWGNIMAGMDVIRRKSGREAESAETGEHEPLAYGLTMPLVTTAKGEKFGKSEGNAIWLDPELVSPYEFYQFFRRTPDSEVQRYLHYFTMLSSEEIKEVMASHEKFPGRHLPQRLLAREVTELVHGAENAQKAQTMSEVSFDGSLAETRGDDILQAFAGDERLVTLDKAQVLGVDIVQVALAGGAVKSKSAGRKILASGGLYLNNQKVPLEGHVLDEKDLIDGVVCVIRTGKSQQRVIGIQ
ncbi:tyrosine-tRNA ligase [Powellomyces hirtus]|nr:tyrosine-tRNA ligase [Powellomyces hirtus]